MWHIAHCTSEVDPGQLQAARAAFEAVLARSDLGFLRCFERSEMLSAVDSRAREIRKACQRVVVCGMGGSALGAQTLLDGVGRGSDTHEVVFFDNVDAERFWAWMRAQKDLSQTHWIFVSKSGSTIETMAMAEFVDQHLRVSGFRKLASCSTVITEFRDSPFFSWAKREGVPLLEVPLDVGGRFSVFTPVGLLPAAIAGLSISEMTEGARWAREQSVMVEALVAQTLSSWRRSESVTLFWAYCDGLRSFGRWMQQLWAESLGKANTRGGGVPLQTSTPIPLVGANDQHSVLQQVMDGPRDKFVWFLRNHRSEVEGPVLDRSLFEPASPLIGRSLGELFSAEADATREALAQRNVKSLTLECENLDSRTIGGLLMLSMLTVATLGEVLDINAFDQPGVELGKSLARSKLLS